METTIMKRIEKLTPDQESQLPIWRDKWIAIGLQTGEIDMPRFRRGIETAYSVIGVPWHNNIIIVQNPLIGALASAIAGFILAKNNAVRDAVGVAANNAVGGAVNNAVNNAVGGAVRGAANNAVRDAVGVAVNNAVNNAVGGAVNNAVNNAVGGAVRGAANNAVRDAVGVAVRDAVSDAVNNAVGGAVNNAVRDAVNNAVSDAVRGAANNAVGVAVRVAVRDAVSDAVGVADLSEYIKQNWYNFLGGQFWVGGWYYGNAYVTYFRDVCGLELSDDIMNRMSAYEDINSSACYVWPHTNFVMVCERPKHINRDNNGQLHCATGSSIAWDGFELFHWHGIAIPKEWMTGNPPTPAEAITWENIEQRRAACEIIGWINILQNLDAKVIDKDDDPEIGTLLEVDIPDSGKELFLQVRCATGRDFALIVTNSKAKTALEAQMWMFPVPPEFGKYLKPVLTA